MRNWQHQYTVLPAFRPRCPATAAGTQVNHSPGGPPAPRSRMDSRDRLLALLTERSLRLGRFTLASGTRSTYYVDARATTMTAEGQALVGQVCLSYLRRADLDPTHVGGLTMGADPIAYAIARRSWEEGRPVGCVFRPQGCEGVRHPAQDRGRSSDGCARGGDRGCDDNRPEHPQGDSGGRRARRPGARRPGTRRSGGRGR